MLTKERHNFSHYFLIVPSQLEDIFLVFKVEASEVKKTEGKLTYKKCVEFLKENCKEARLWL